MNIGKRTDWIFIAGIVALTFFCILLQSQIATVDTSVFDRLMAALGTSKTASTAPLLLELLVTVAVAAIAMTIGVSLSKKARLFAFGQLFVITFLVQWCLYNAFGFNGHPIGIACTLTLGGLIGYMFRRGNLRAQRFESQYHELMLRNRELQETRLQMVKQDEVERRMLAADLHDQVLNDLKALKHNVESYVQTPQPELISIINRLLQQSMTEIREVMDSLCPSALEHLGLVAAIEDCCRRGSERAKFKTRFKAQADQSLLERLSVVEQSLIYRLVQESITNVCKHAGAETVRTNLNIENEQLVIKIADDGKGIEPGKLKQESRGLRYMRQRAELIGATIAWRPGDGGKGTTVEIRVDLSKKNGNTNTHS